MTCGSHLHLWVTSFPGLFATLRRVCCLCPAPSGSAQLWRLVDRRIRPHIVLEHEREGTFAGPEVDSMDGDSDADVGFLQGAENLLVFFATVRGHCGLTRCMALGVLQCQDFMPTTVCVVACLLPSRVLSHLRGCSRVRWRRCWLLLPPSLTLPTQRRRPCTCC